MARLTLDYKSLYDKVGEFLGYVAHGTTPTGNDLTVCKDIIHRGYRQFLYPIDARNGQLYEWNFLKQYWTFSTVNNQWKYAVPNDFSDFLTDLNYDLSEGKPALLKRSAEQIMDMRNLADESGYPEFYAVVASKYDLEVGTTYEIWLHPKPSQAYILHSFYRIDPLKPSATTDLLVGGIRATEAILESCLGVAEHQEDDVATTHHMQKAAELIQALIVGDTITESDLIGNLHRNRFGGWPYDKYRGWPQERLTLTNTNIDNVYS